MNTSTFLGTDSMKFVAFMAGLVLMGLAWAGCTEAIDEEDDSRPGDGAGSLHVEPVLYENAMGDTCRDAGIAFEIEGAEDWIDCKIDSPPRGENTFGDAGDFDENGAAGELCAQLLELSMDIYDTERGEEMDWESLNEQGIIAVLVKGGLDANFYYYETPVLDDQGLHAPFPPGQDHTWADISHVSFCIGEVPPPVERVLSVSKDVHTTAERTYSWKIKKKATPDYHEIEKGNDKWPESRISDYAVKVYTTGFSDAFSAFGTITIENETDADAQIADVTDLINGTRVPVDCGVLFEPYYLLEAGESLECDYEVLGLTGEEDTNEVTVTVTDESLVDGATATEPVDFPEAVEILDEVTVVDQFVGEQEVLLGTCRADDELPCKFTYYREFFCPDDDGIWKNVATIVETEQSAKAKVEVVCTDLPKDDDKDKKKKKDEVEEPPEDDKPKKKDDGDNSQYEVH